MRICLSLLPAALLTVGCDTSSSTPVVLATAVIGPSGGEVQVDSGPQAGMRLTVPAGAVGRDTEIRIVDERRPIGSGLNELSYAPLVGERFRIEPSTLPLAADAVLRAPYRPRRVGNTAPGNVRLRRFGSELTQLDPTLVDIESGWIEIAIAEFGAFQVVRGPSIGGPFGYLPATGASVELENGFSFSIEETPAPSPLTGEPAVRWRIRRPDGDEALTFVGSQLIGRESKSGGWQEQWSEAFSPWRYVEEAQGNGFTTATTIAPSIALMSQGAISVFGFWQFGAPRQRGERLIYDVLELRLQLAWDRPDLGVGQRDYTFWFAPEEGLLALSVDGVVHEHKGGSASTTQGDTARAR